VQISNSVFLQMFFSVNIFFRVFSKRARLTTHMIKVHNQEVGAGEECPASTHHDCSGDEEEDIELDKASLNLFCCGDCFAVYKTLPELTEHECQSRDDIIEEVRQINIHCQSMSFALNIALLSF
jgi:hypothetical protein